MKKLSFLNYISIALDILIYIFFILSGFEATLPFYIFLGLNAFSFFYHYIILLLEKMSLIALTITQALLVAAVFLTYYGLMMIKIDLQSYRYTVWVVVVVAILLLMSYIIYKFKHRNSKKDITTTEVVEEISVEEVSAE